MTNQTAAERIAQKYGYVTLAAARAAVQQAQQWVARHKGKKMPIHIEKAAKLYQEIMEMQRQQGLLAKERVQAASVRNPRVWFGIIPDGTRAERFRRGVRRIFRLHYNREGVQKYLRLILPPETADVWENANYQDRAQAIEQLAGITTHLFGFEDFCEDRAAAMALARGMAWGLWDTEDA